MALFAAALCLVGWQPIEGQRLPDRWLERSASTPAPVRPGFGVQRADESRIGRMVVAGTLGAAAGLVGGGVLGYRIERRFFPCSCDDPGLLGMVIGGVVGSTFVVPVSIHLANDRRGSLARDLGISALIGGVGLAGAFAASRSELGLVFLFGAPVAQIITVMLAESGAGEGGG